MWSLMAGGRSPFREEGAGLRGASWGGLPPLPDPPSPPPGALPLLPAPFPPPAALPLALPPPALFPFLPPPPAASASSPSLLSAFTGGVVCDCVTGTAPSPAASASASSSSLTAAPGARISAAAASPKSTGAWSSRHPSPSSSPPSLSTNVASSSTASMLVLRLRTWPSYRARTQLSGAME